MPLNGNVHAAFLGIVMGLLLTISVRLGSIQYTLEDIRGYIAEQTK